MAIITKGLVRLKAWADDRADAIRQAGELLVRNGRVKPAYVEGMLARERIMSTYFGGGVAIPHGQFANRVDVLRAGISVVQYPAGVEWEDGELAYLVVGIAVTADEHVDVLANLSQMAEEPGNMEQLVRTTDPMLIVKRLDRVAYSA